MKLYNSGSERKPLQCIYIVTVAIQKSRTASIQSVPLTLWICSVSIRTSWLRCEYKNRVFEVVEPKIWSVVQVQGCKNEYQKITEKSAPRMPIHLRNQLANAPWLGQNNKLVKCPTPISLFLCLLLNILTRAYLCQTKSQISPIIFSYQYCGSDCLFCG